MLFLKGPMEYLLVSWPGIFLVENDEIVTEILQVRKENRELSLDQAKKLNRELEENC
jgi:hypothetical protein